MKKLITFLISMMLAVSPVLSADDTQRGLVYVLDDFSGGLASKVSPYGLSPRFATVAENIRINKKFRSLSRRSNLSVYGTADATEPITGMFRHYMLNGSKVLLVTHGDEMEKGNDSTGTFETILNLSAGDRRWQFVTWHNIAIGTDGYNQPIKYDGTSDSATYLGSLLAIVSEAGSGPASGIYSYKVSCYSTTYEVLLNTASNEITADGNDVSLSMIPICPDTLLNGEATTGRKIYRTETSGSTYKLLSNGTIANNTATTLTDSDADAALGVTMPAGDATWAPPKARFIIVQNNRLFLANDPTNSPSRVWYSEDSSHDIFINDHYLDVRQNDGDTITFIKGVIGQLTVGKNNTIQTISINEDDPVDWSVSDPITYIGCQAPYSAVNSRLGIIYAGRNGIYLFTGYRSELLSESVTPIILDINPTNFENIVAVYNTDDTYHIAYNSTEAGGSLNNRVLVLDLLSKSYTIDTLKINAFTIFNSGNDWGVQYAGASDTGQIYAYSSEVNEFKHYRQSDFAGQWDDMRYIPISVGGSENSPVLELAWTETIDELSGTINSLKGIIDRPDTVGHYVSQPILVGANALDKIYWNEQIPVTGGEVTFQVRTSPTGETNLLLNDDFEFWDNWVTATPLIEQPNDWTFAQDGTGGAVDQETTQKNRGTSSVEITKSNSGQSYISFDIPNASNYQSKTLVFSGYAKSANSVASKVRIQITDGTTTATANYANGGDWEELETTLAVSASATTITAKLVVETGADAVAYFDQVMVREASTAANDWSAWSSEVTDSSGGDISGATGQDYVQYLINMETDDIDFTPNIIRVGQYAVKLTYSREGTPQSSDIPMVYRTGFLDLGHANRPKVIRGIEAYHTGETGDYTITIEAYQSGIDGAYVTDEDEFAISLGTYPTKYKDAATDGALVGELFIIEISMPEGTESFSFDKLIINYDIEPHP